MAEITNTRMDTTAFGHFELPKGVRLFEIAGPLFFGATQKAVSVLDQVQKERGGSVVLDLSRVPVMDATGLVALETMLGKLRRNGHKVILAGVNPQPAQVLARAQIKREPGQLAYAPDLDTALSMAIVHTSRTRTPTVQPLAASPAPLDVPPRPEGT